MGRSKAKMTRNFQEFLAFDNAEMITPIGVSLGMRGDRPDLFVLEIIGDKDSPIRVSGKMIAFQTESLCRTALEKLKPLLPVGVKIEQKYDFICDIPGAIKLVMEQEDDSDAVVLNCINTLLDFVATGFFDLPDEYRILRALADRLTFRGEFGEFKQTRILVRNALLWCAGVAVVDVMLIQSHTEFEALLPSLSATENR
jgi:hypothetical protein